MPTMDGSRLFTALFTIACLPLAAVASAGAQEILPGPPLSESAAPPSALDLIATPTASDPEQWTEPGKPTGETCFSDAVNCCRLCPCCYGVVEALILERNVSGSSFPLAVDATTGATLLSTNDLNFPFAGGLRAYVGHRFCGCWAWELGYFGLFDANASTSITGDLALPNDLGPGTNVFFGADRFDLDYTSRLHGGELNFVCCCCCCEPCCVPRCSSVEWIYGFRYLRVDELLDIRAERLEVGGVETGTYNVRASNDLYGGQFGVRLRHCRGPWSVEGTGKIGLFGNDANTSQTVTDFPSFVVRQTSSSDSDLAFLGELNLSLIRQVSDHWFVRGGYNLIWIDGIALAPDQLDFSLTSTSGTTIDDDNTMFLHGVNVGIEARW
jgi:putative beta barrel porin BBP7